jgi:hypothetical protein
MRDDDASTAPQKSNLPPAPPLDVSQRQTERTTPTGVPNKPAPTTDPRDALIKQLQDQYYASLAQLGAGGGSSTAAADLAERKREFDITTQRDIAKENATEVDSLQKMLAGLSGPKDVYADLFFSHGYAPPRGYQPAPVPLTDAQKSAYQAMGVTPQQLQSMITGNGQPGADTGMLGSLGQSLQPQPGLPQFDSVQPNQVQATGPSNPTQQGGALYGKAPAGATPSMATGGEVPGQTGDPRLIVAHGGEEVDNNTDQGQLAPMNNSDVHPAIQKLMDALSELLANPDFAQFAGIAGKAAAMGKGKGPSDQLSKMAPPQDSQVTPGGVQSMAVGGTVGGTTSPTSPTSPGSNAPLTASQTLSYQQSGRNPLLTPTPPITPSPVPTNSAPKEFLNTGGAGAATTPAKPTSGVPIAGAQGVISGTPSIQPTNPIMPVQNMDPYTRALLDVHGRLHPYSAQQQAQMGSQGTGAVDSYIGKVLGGDVNAYKDLVDRLKPMGAAPTASTGSASEGFSFG